MTDMKGIDFLAGDRIWSESVYADCVSEDGATGFILRLCRYPDQNIAWVWVHGFLPGKILAFNDNYLSCPEGLTMVEGADITYALPGQPSVMMMRNGPRDRPLSARVSSSVIAHLSPHAPNGAGTIPLYIEAELEPRHSPWRPNKYRSEWLGNVKGKIVTEGRTAEILGLGHWHEQHQKAPRWQVPFTYISLRGRNLALIATAIKDSDRGHILRGSKITRVLSISMAPPGRRRHFTFSLEDGSLVQGQTRTIHEYSVPIYKRRRPGTLVTAEVEGEILSGCVNDWVM